MKELFGILALTVSVGANIPYIFDIIKGNSKPERISWFLWTLLGFTYYFSAVFDDGAKVFTMGELIGPVLILLLSFKYGVGGKSRFDLYSLAVALIAFSLLFVVDGTLVSLLLALLVDGIGITLTLRKVRLDPASESRVFWGLGLVSSSLALLSLTNFTVETLLFPVYVFVASSCVFVLANPNKIKNIDKIEKL